MDIFDSMTINDQQIHIKDFKKGEIKHFTIVLDSGDKICITQKCTLNEFGLSTKLQYYDKNGSVKTITTESKGWTCDGKTGVHYKEIRYRECKGKVNDYLTAFCNINIP